MWVIKRLRRKFRMHISESMPRPMGWFALTMASAAKCALLVCIWIKLDSLCLVGRGLHGIARRRSATRQCSRGATQWNPKPPSGHSREVRLASFLGQVFSWEMRFMSQVTCLQGKAHDQGPRHTIRLPFPAPVEQQRIVGVLDEAFT